MLGGVSAPIYGAEPAKPGSSSATAVPGVAWPGPGKPSAAKSLDEIANVLTPQLNRDGSAANPAHVPIVVEIRKEYAALTDPDKRVELLKSLFADKKGRGNAIDWWSSLHSLLRQETDRRVIIAAFAMLCEQYGSSNFQAVRIIRDLGHAGDGLPGDDPSLHVELYKIAYKHIQTKMGIVLGLINHTVRMPYPLDNGTIGQVMGAGRDRNPGVGSAFKGRLLITHAELKASNIDAIEQINTWMGTEYRLHPGVQRELYELSVTARGRVIAEDQQNAYGPSRFKSLTNKFDKNKDQISVAHATCLGGAGTEWLSGVTVQPDDTICLVGSGLGPVLEISGRSPQVIGVDSGLPPSSVDWTQSKDAQGKLLFDKIDRPIYDPLTWLDPRATGFILRMSSDLKTIVSFHRLPWGSGGLTSIVSDQRGNLFVAGHWTQRTAAAMQSVCRDVKELPAGDQGGTSFRAESTFIARLSPDSSQVVWVRHMRGVSSSPEIAVDKLGNIVFKGPDLRLFSADGAIKNVIVVPGGLAGTIAYNPANGQYARGGDHQSPTGHEPYRLIYINLFKPDGRKLLELYRADGPFSGGSRMIVSDSSVRAMTFADNGDLLFAGWSDGGNTPLKSQPYDMLAGHGLRGTGMDVSGALGATSVAHLVRLDGKTWKTKGYTIWQAYLASDNRLNGIKIDNIHACIEGSTIFSGGSAWGMIQTGNAISGGEPGGSYVSLMNADLSSLRFSSAMPATGKVLLGDEKEVWNLTSAMVKGRPIAFAVGSAIRQEEVYGKTRPPPMERARQESFGGGLTDGYVLMLDLGEKPPAEPSSADKELEELLGGGPISDTPPSGAKP